MSQSIGKKQTTESNEKSDTSKDLSATSPQLEDAPSRGSTTSRILEDAKDEFPTYPSYNYPEMPPPYPSRYDVISLGMGAGVGIGGIIGMIVAIWIPSAIGETIVMFAGMAIGTIIGGGIGLGRYFLSKPLGDTDYLIFDKEQGFKLSE